MIQASVSRRRLLFISLLCVGLAVLAYVVYLLTSLQVGGALLMPLDDAYIHFQYAHQIARGEFYVYNPGLPPTSGATSFLYPYLLAVGDLIGLRGLALGAWAMGVGAAAFAGSGIFAYRLADALGARLGLALLAALAVMLNGALVWHANSGMETLLVVCLALLTLDGLARRNVRVVLIGGVLSALVRPEGAVLAFIAFAAAFAQDYAAIPVQARRVVMLNTGRLRQWLLLALIPLAALLVQPTVNLLVTGSAVASGNSAKSILGVIPFNAHYVINRIIDNFIRLWREFLFPSGDSSVYLVFGVGIFALIGVVWLVRRRAILALALIAWWIVLALALSTLDTAFWHFKRYQMPLMITLIPLAVVGVEVLIRRVRAFNRQRALLWAAAAFVLLPSVFSQFEFYLRYTLNIGYVRDQPYQMALWLRENTPENARIAVHDVGMMRYVGGRTTIDVVGLTTPGAADDWRNGPGAVGEFLTQTRPDYIASYGVGHGLGLGYLEATDLYAEPLAVFPVALDPQRNVALAADVQGIYRPNWAMANAATDHVVLASLGLIAGEPAPVDTVDVANLNSERDHGYQWSLVRPTNGFPTEYNQFRYQGCDDPRCTVMDGGRRINGEESFVMQTRANEDALLITRLHPGDAGEYDVYVDDALIAQRVIPPLPGTWLDVPVLIPAAHITGERTSIRIVPRVAGDYQPYRHDLYQGDYRFTPSTTTPLATFQDGAVRLYLESSNALSTDENMAVLPLIWETPTGANGDYKVFVHVLNDTDQIVAQADVRPAQGNLPFGNWIPGAFHDTIKIDLTNAESGMYRVVLGIYNPVTNERLIPENAGDRADAFSRLMIGELEVE